MNAEGDQRVREIEARYREKERRGKVAGPNPWRANTLEWVAPSPPPVQ